MKNENKSQHVGRGNCVSYIRSAAKTIQKPHAGTGEKTNFRLQMHLCINFVHKKFQPPA